MRKGLSSTWIRLRSLLRILSKKTLYRLQLIKPFSSHLALLPAILRNQLTLRPSRVSISSGPLGPAK